MSLLTYPVIYLLLHLQNAGTYDKNTVKRSENKKKQKHREIKQIPKQIRAQYIKRKLFFSKECQIEHLDRKLERDGSAQ